MLDSALQEADVEGQIKTLVMDIAVPKTNPEGTRENWSIAKGVGAAAAAVARAAAARAAGAVGNLKSKLAAGEGAGNGGGYEDMEDGGGWQNDAASEGASSAADWEE
jgi:hypothetical protein